MPQVKVLIQGQHKKNNNKVRITSSVILIKNKKYIIVDTGSFLERKSLIDNLKKENLRPGDIDIVILSHLHLDHLVNVDLFKDAQIFCKFKGFNYPGQIHTFSDGCLQRTEIRDGTKIINDVELMLTPGHSDDMISTVVDTKKGKIIITGDAIPNEEWADLKKQPDPIIVQNVKEFNDSRKKILEMADYIIPGHGKQFKVKK